MLMQDEKKALKEFQGALQFRMAGNDEQVREKLQVSFEPRSEKTGLRGFRPGPTQTGLYSHRRLLEA